MFVCLLLFNTVRKVGSQETISKTRSPTKIGLIQMCENCVERTEDVEMVLPTENFNICESYCDKCYKNDTVCEDFSIKGQTEPCPSVRACDDCLNNSVKCIRRVVLAITVDCESGNKFIWSSCNKNSVIKRSIRIYRCFWFYPMFLMSWKHAKQVFQIGIFN